MASVRRLPAVIVVCGLVLISSSCGEFQRDADAQFGDQNFKSAIALIELHKVRFGTYPDNLADLKFTGPWDQTWISAVTYRRLDEGYELNLVRGWVGMPGLEYPADFWRGLGVRKTNVRRTGA